MSKYLLSLAALLLCGLVVMAQPSLTQVETELSALAKDILEHPDLEHKKVQNRTFTRKLIQHLKRPESFDYEFDSLKTISILRAEDNSFRIFTWQIVNLKDPDTYYGESRHYYFGLIQRKYIAEDGQEEYIVIPLIEMQEIPRGVENVILDNTKWLGGLYYPPKYGKGIQKQTLKYFDPKGLKQGQKVKAKKQDYYVLMGWNGMDHTSNLKFIDVLSFDPNDKNKVLFGANVFYFDPLVPKFRALFKYSEYAPFTLNYGYIKGGLFSFSKKRAIVYDHMGTPKVGAKELKEIWTMGPDGSYDALVYSRGAYDWKKNVETVSVLSTRDKMQYAENQEEILRARLQELKKMAEYMGDSKVVAEIEEIEGRKDLDQYAIKYLKRKEKLILKKQAEIQKREQKKLKEAGIDLSGSDK